MSETEFTTNTAPFCGVIPPLGVSNALRKMNADVQNLCLVEEQTQVTDLSLPSIPLFFSPSLTFGDKSLTM